MLPSQIFSSPRRINATLQGSNPSFNGVKVKYVPDVVASSDQNDSFTILSPGQSVEVEHDRMFPFNVPRVVLI
jgi:peptidyl-Lys metalloendopeptidase